MSALVDHPLYQMVLCRFREFYREPGSVFWAFAFPILISLALGLAFRNQEPVAVDVAVVPSPSAEASAKAISASPLFKVTSMEEPAARRALQGNKVSLVVLGDPPRILADDTQQNTPMMVAALKDALERGAGRADTLALPTEKVVSVGTRYIDFLLPGMLGFSIMSSSIWGIGWSLVQLRTRRLMKRLVATPMKRSHLLASFMVQRLMLGAVELAVLVAFGVLAFGVVLQGSFFTLFGLSVLGSLAFGGLALLTASRAQNAETASGLMNLINMPMTVFSGVFFSAEKFPEWLQPFIRALPLTALNDGLRKVMNEGAGVMNLGWEIGVMVVWAVISFTIALKVFRWQ